MIEKKKIKENASVQSQPIDAAESVKKSNYKMDSLFDGVFCEYDYDFDNSYIKWLLTSGVDVVSPVITNRSVLPVMNIKIPDVAELLKDTKLPADFISTAVTNSSDEEELIIL